MSMLKFAAVEVRDRKGKPVGRYRAVLVDAPDEGAMKRALVKKRNRNMVQMPVMAGAVGALMPLGVGVKSLKASLIGGGIGAALGALGANVDYNNAYKRMADSAGQKRWAMQRD